MPDNNSLRFNVQAAPEKASGVYANASVVSSTGNESRIDFLYVDHANKRGDEVPAHLAARVIMPTSDLANLSETLNDHIAKHLEHGLD